MNSFNTLSTLQIGGKTYHYHSMEKLEQTTGVKLASLPYSMKVLIENLLRHEDGEIVSKKDIEAVLKQDPKKESDYEIQFTPARVLLQDFTGVPVVADLAAMRDAMADRKGDAKKVNPLVPVDLVIDHSVQMDSFGQKDSLATNIKLEFERNGERYEFLKWGQQAFNNFRVVPPATGICHQVNLEYLSHVAMTGETNQQQFIYPDTLVGTDSHTTMINGLGVVGWGVGGIEAEAAMLGQPCTMLIPQVIGFEMKGRLKPGVTATDLVLTCTQMLRKRGVVGKFVEYFGEGVKNLSIADRATVANMSPEYGATIGVFPVDEKVIDYLRSTGRKEKAERAEAYYKTQKMWGVEGAGVQFADVLTLDLSTVEPSMSGPSRPQDRVSLSQARTSFRKFLLNRHQESLGQFSKEKLEEWTQMSDSMKGLAYEMSEFHPHKDLGPLGATADIKTADGSKYKLSQGSIVMAAITSCTNTSNPTLMLGAALLARNAVKKGLKVKPWVKTTFAPGSLAVRDYVESSGLMPSLEALGFNIAGFGCAVCIGNSGPLPKEIQEAIDKTGIATVSVLSGNRNFEARIHPSVMANYLASPILVVASALAGNINVDMANDPLSLDSSGQPVFLKDIWPDAQELADLVAKHVTPSAFEKVYSDVLSGDAYWKATKAPKGETYTWSESSTYIKQPPFLSPELSKTEKQVKNARILAIFGDSITTDHISPAGNIGAKSPAGQYLVNHKVDAKDFNSYGSRRGNHEVMMRGTFANVRIKNKIAGREGGFTKVFPEGKEAYIYDAAQTYEQKKTPLVIFAGKEYGSGSSRDWAAKGTRLLGVRAVVAESFERIHRSNLVGMGVLPLQLPAGVTVDSLGLVGDEEIDLPSLDQIQPKQDLQVTLRSAKGSRAIATRIRIDTPNELKYYQSGGILPFVLDRLAKS
ncbi:MAG: aconitate hydratase AcnA [Pseudobdellovibrionaceae bacterium]